MQLLLSLLLPLALAPQQGVQVNTHPGTGLDILGDAGNEPTIAVSPVNANLIVIGWRDFPTVASSARKAGYAFSVDGGASFNSGGALIPPPGFPPSTQQTDPVMSVDSAGVFTYWSEVFVPSFSQTVYRSFDGGVSWPQVAPVEVPVTSGDKCWVVTDRTGGFGDGFIYGGWNNFSLGGQCFVRSIDGGLTFSTAVRIADRGGTQWMLHYVVGPNGEVYAGWRHFNDDAIYITKSINANDLTQVPSFDALGAGGINGIDVKIDDDTYPGFLSINPVGFHQLYLGVDHSNGPRRGWVYALWSDGRNDICDIILARSQDGGASWQTGIRVNDDTLGNGAYQWMPAMSLAPNGRIDVVWYDTRNDSVNPDPLSQLYYAFSLDGGDSWSVNRRASDAFDTTLGYPSQDKIGDYIESKSDDDGMNVAYAATFNGGQDVYFLRLRPTIHTVNNLVAGQVATFAIESGRANAPAWLLASLQGPGTTPLPGLNVTTSLQNPILVDQRRNTNGFGNVSWNVPIPNKAFGRTIWSQVVQQENGSNRVEAVVQ